MYAFGKRSKDRLGQAHPDLQKVMNAAIPNSGIDFGIGQSLRQIEEQKKNVAKGASQTMNSRHLDNPKDNLKDTSYAVDITVYVNGQYVNGDTPAEYELYEKVAKLIKATAVTLGIEIVWGGDWKTFKDGCHFELNRKFYP